jgi:hypothetical protein
MDWREMCVSRAADCEQKAMEAHDAEVQAVYRALAQQWRQLAQEPEPRISKKPGDDEAQ